MTVTGKSEFVKLVEKYKSIYPFTHALLDGDGYVLTVKEEVTLNYLGHRNMISHEVVFTPPNYVAHLTAESVRKARTIVPERYQGSQWFYRQTRSRIGKPEQ